MQADIIFIIIFLGVLILLAVPMGAYMAKVFTGKRTFMSPIVRPLERLVYKLCMVRESEEMSWKQYSVAFLIFNGIGLVTLFLLQVVQGRSAAQPDGFRACPLGHRTQHGHIVRDKHKLAGLRRRDDHELSYSNAWYDSTELRLGGSGHGGAAAAHPGFYLQTERNHRQFLGRYDPVGALRSAPPEHYSGHPPCVARCRTDLPPLCKGRDTGRRRAGHSRRDRRLLRSPSSSSVPTAAVSSTPIPPILSKTRHRSPMLWNSSPSFSYLRRCLSRSAKWSITGGRATPSLPR